MLFVFDQNFNVIHVTSDPADFISGTALEQINGEHSCTIEIPWTSTTQKHFKEFNHIGFMIDGRFEVYTIRQILDIKDGFAQREIYCEHLSYELTKDIVEDRRIDKGPASDIITRILSDTDWKVGEIAELGNQTYNAYYINHRKALYEIAEIYGGELRFRIELNENKSAIANKYVDLLPTRGTDTGIRFLFNRNLKKIERETDTLEVFTALIGRGHSPETENGGQQRRIQFTDVAWSKASGDPVDKPKGQNWVGHPEAIAKYGMIRGVYEDESETPEELLANTWASLQNQCEPTYTYKADLIFIKDLMKEYLDEDGDTVLRLGDHFIIVDDEIGMEISTRIIGIEYDLLDIANSTVTMGQFYKTLGDKSDYDKLQSQIDSIRDTINGNEDIVFDDESFPDTVPPKSTVTAEGLFASIKLSWTYENKTYYEYALYASQTKGFAPAQQNLIFRGHASSFLHSVKPDQTWYYRVCAYNTHGQRNEFSEEVSAHSAKIANAEDYIEHASIGSALIGSVDADTINAGKVKAEHIELKGVSVVDGNGKKTLEIDSYGRVRLDVTELTIDSSSVATTDGVADAIEEAVSDLDSSYAIFMSNEVQTIPTTATRQPIASTTYTADIKVYQGTRERTNYTIGNIASANGITVTKTTNSIKFAVSTDTTLTADSGVFSIPITIDGRTFTKIFSWSCAKQGIQGPAGQDGQDGQDGTNGQDGADGQDGKDGYTIILTNENHAFPASDTGNISSVITIATQAIAYKGAQLLSATFGTLPSITGLTLSASGNTLTIKANTGTSLADAGTINVPVVADGKTFTKIFSWTKAKQGATGAQGPQGPQGATGATGPAGTSAKSVDIIATSQVFKSTDGGKTFSPDTIKLTPILQNVTYSNWQYSTNGGSSWNGFTNSITGWSVSGGILTIDKSCSLFTATTTSVAFRVNTNDSSIYDVMTIVKLYDVTDLNIGARNLYKNTKNIVKNDWGNNANWGTTEAEDGFTAFTRTGTWMGLYQDITFITGQTYTLSAYVRGVDGAKLHFYFNGSGSTLATSFDGNNVLSESWTRVWATFKVNGSDFARPRFENSVEGATLQIYAFKMERGNKATDWSPAPEDFDSIIDAVNNELKQEISNSVAGLQDQNNQLLDRIDEAFDDNVLSSHEKIQLKDDLRTIDGQYESMKNMVTQFGDNAVQGQFSALTLRHQELHALIDPLLTDLNSATEASNATIRESLYQYQLQYNITFVALQTMIDDRLNTLTTTVSTTADGVQTAITKSNSALDGVQTIGKHFNFTDSGWVEIFATLNGVPGRFKTQITDQRLAFLDNNVEVAYMSNQQLYITRAQILNDLQLGNISQSKTAKGGLIYQWKG